MSASSSPPSRRYLALWLRRLSTDRLVRSSSPVPDESERAETASGESTPVEFAEAKFAPDAPLVVIQAIKSAQRIVAMNDAAQRLGLRTNMPLADARAMHPGLAVAAADEAADRQTLEDIADWCDRYTPLIGLDLPDGLILDITGCAHLFGGETALCRDLLARLARQGFHARAAVADTAGCAWGVAHYGEAALVPPQRMRAVLIPLPAAALRLAPETVTALAEVGLKAVGDLLDLPRAPLAARFGERLVRRIDQALGREDELITPRLPLPSYVAEQRFADPIGLERDVLGTIGRLAGKLGAAMERREEGARLLQAVLFRTDNKVYRIEVATGAPLREASRIVRLFTDRLAAIGDACDPGFGYDMVRLAAIVTERSAPVQAALAAGNDAPADDAELWHLIDRLGARFGPRRVTRLVPQNTHIPEFAVAALPASRELEFRERAAFTGAVPAASPSPPSPASGRGSPAAACGTAPALPLPAGGERVGVRGRFHESEHLQLTPERSKPTPETSMLRLAARPPHSARQGAPTSPRPRGEVFVAASDESEPGSGPDFQDSLSPSRPVRLFARPEPVEAVAEVPDGPPARFRWRRVLHEVVIAEGPERIAMEWWRDETGQALTRDYFRLECRDGLRAWLYREGLFGRETAQPRWFLHGLFG
jgi:protein ImuB